jgi:TolA-binding protein
MTILRWLLSHMLLLIFVALGVTAWLNRDQLQIEAILEDLRAPVDVHEQARAQEGERAPVADAAPAKVIASPPADQRAEVQTAAVAELKASRSQPEALAAQPASRPAEGALRGVAPEPDSELGAKLTDDWYAARRAFWDADLAEAERLYQALILENPDKPDAYGELGNLYYSQGAWVEAAKMYHQAGLLLIDQGESHRAASLMGILTALNPNLADELQEKLSKPQ